MSKWAKFCETLASGRSGANISYADLVSYLERLGWKSGSGGTSHRFYTHPLVAAAINIQPGRAARQRRIRSSRSGPPWTCTRGTTKMDGYEVKVYFSREDQVYVAEIVEFVGCAVDGPTPEAALANLRDAKTAWVAAMQTQGHPVPPPRHALVAA